MSAQIFHNNEMQPLRKDTEKQKPHHVNLNQLQ